VRPGARASAPARRARALRPDAEEAEGRGREPGEATGVVVDARERQLALDVALERSIVACSRLSRASLVRPMRA
jgi:hypothetical protein